MFMWSPSWTDGFLSKYSGFLRYKHDTKASTIANVNACDSNTLSRNRSKKNLYQEHKLTLYPLLFHTFKLNMCIMVH